MNVRYFVILGDTVLNFADWTGCGAFTVLWPQIGDTQHENIMNATIIRMI